MREFLFKAKRLDSGEWVFGQYVAGHFIVEYPGIFYEACLDTICQYTGAEDKNGAKIFENDKFIFVDEPGNEYVVSWDNENCCFFAKRVKDSFCIGQFDAHMGNNIIVTGNIYDEVNKNETAR